MVDEEQELARVTITTDRRTLRDISTDDIQAMADLQQAVSLETDPVMVPITAVCKGVSCEQHQNISSESECASGGEADQGIRGEHCKQREQLTAKATRSALRL